MAKTIEERDLAVATRHANGETFQDVANSVGLTRQRVEQIARKQGTTKKQGGVYQQRHIRMQTLLNTLTPLLLEGLSRPQLQEKGVAFVDLDWVLSKQPALRKQWKAAVEVAQFGITLTDLMQVADRYGKTWQELMVIYQSSRKNARNRGCAWNLNLVQWLALWEASGAWSLLSFNPKPRHGLVLIDRTDLDYRVGNVRILPQSEISALTQARVWADIRNAKAKPDAN